jgi:hypothetical protein
MKRIPFTFWGNLVYATLLFVGILLVGYILKQHLPDVYGELPNLGKALGVVGVLAVIMGFTEYRRKIAFERTDMAIQFMLRFYENDRLDDFRMALRDPNKPYSVWNDDGSLKNDVVLGMNSLEALAISVEEGCFPIKTCFPSAEMARVKAFGQGRSSSYFLHAGNNLKSQISAP